jgi:hypothetical protein
MHPQACHAVYLDSGSAKRKYYTHIKEVLDEALTGSAFKQGCLKAQKTRGDKLVLRHKVEFLCV